MPKVKVVLDTNVLISAVLFGGKPRQTLEMVIQSQIDAYISPAILTEFREVLIRPKFGLDQKKCFSIIREIEDISNLVFPQIKFDIIKDDPEDNKILECAVAAGANYIITGDPHLLNLSSFENIKILSPASFVVEYSLS